MSDVDVINNIVIQFNRYAPIPILIFGLIGNTLNILIFTRRSLVKNPCTIYFLSSTVVNINVLFFGCVIRSLRDGFHIDPMSTSLPFCRFRYYILHCSMVLSSWFTVLAGIDRYCISCRDHQRRQLSNRRYARYSVLLTTLICLALYSHVLGLFRIEQLQTGPECYARIGIYRIFYDFLYFATFSFTPPILMIFIGLATFRNIHHSRMRVNPNGIPLPNGTQLNKRDRQLISMLLVQLVAIVICTLPIAIQKLYTTFTANLTKSAYRLATETLIVQITRQLLFLNSSTSFYV